MKNVNNIVIVLIVFAAIVLLVAILSGDRNGRDSTVLDRQEDEEQVDESETENEVTDETEEDNEDNISSEDVNSDLVDQSELENYEGNIEAMIPFKVGNEVYSFDAIEWLFFPEGSKTRVNFDIVGFSRTADGTLEQEGRPFGTGNPHDGVCTATNNVVSELATVDGNLIAAVMCETDTDNKELALFQDGNNLRLSESVVGSDTWTEIRVIDMTSIRR